MKNDTLCLFSYIQEKRPEPQLSLLDWIHDNPLPAPTENQDILKEYYEDEIHDSVKRFFFSSETDYRKHLKHRNFRYQIMRFSFLVKNYPLPKKEETWDIIMIREAQKETDEILKKTRNFINLCEPCWNELEGDA